MPSELCLYIEMSDPIAIGRSAFPDLTTHTRETRLDRRARCYYCRAVNNWRKQQGKIWISSDDITRTYSYCRQCGVALCKGGGLVVGGDCWGKFHALEVVEDIEFNGLNGDEDDVRSDVEE